MHTNGEGQGEVEETVTVTRTARVAHPRSAPVPQRLVHDEASLDREFARQLRLREQHEERVLRRRRVGLDLVLRPRELVPEGLITESHEDEVINRVAIEQELARLDPVDRETVVLAYGYDMPDDYVGLWPPTLSEIGDHISRKFGAGSASSSVCERLLRIEAEWRARWDR